VSRNSEEYIVKVVRPGYFQMYRRDENGDYVKFGVESLGGDTLIAEAKRLNAKALGKANRANEETIAVLTSEQMKRTGCDYTTAFCNIRKQKPELFRTMRDPSAHSSRRK
jgi:hypothetical protein